MTDRFDKLGRRIPVYDRSAAGKKSAKTRKEKHGDNDHARAGALGGKHRTRGYFGYLKDNHEEETLRALSQAAREAKKARKAERSDSVGGASE